MTKTKPYREELFQWVWKHLELDCSKLQTVCGKSVKVIDPGKWNHGGGPDFPEAHLQIAGRDWFGSVEIHRKSDEWYLHQHHLDEHFNSVILHVVYENDHQTAVKTKDGYRPFTLVLKPYITKEMHRLLETKHGSGIACSGNVTFINQEAFEQQVQLAHGEYLEYKIEELLSVYDASLPLSAAWKHCLIAGAYRMLGIPANKNQMEELALHVLKEHKLPENASSFTEAVKNIAFRSESDILWVKSGMRPASRPELRVQQAAAFHYAVIHAPFSLFFKNDPEQSWNQLIRTMDSSALPGKPRLDIIRQIVYLPALYLLGDLLHSGKLRNQTLTAWKSSAQHIPEEVKKPFKKAGFQVNRSTRVMGLAHQYKRYCKEKNCHQCEVFKKAIRS